MYSQPRTILVVSQQPIATVRAPLGAAAAPQAAAVEPAASATPEVTATPAPSLEPSPQQPAGAGETAATEADRAVPTFVREELDTVVQVAGSAQLAAAEELTAVTIRETAAVETTETATASPVPQEGRGARGSVLPEWVSFCIDTIASVCSSIIRAARRAAAAAASVVAAIVSRGRSNCEEQDPTRTEEQPDRK
ncbi:hypothetical protein, conserved [Eimeria necatrix]|uniref:Uncharacterized protein n=1 Tax=Eimeria necatrix TaxID=51315 RepID=U6MDS4_9EIME|nr:hypothetical protein, conserved [Eimeria necatrix]CDJ62402.1 hypothetical protein, conserved [Eimeria necatrix]